MSVRLFSSIHPFPSQRAAARLTGALAAVAALCGVAAGQPAGQPAHRPRCGGSLEGHVVDEATHEPVIGAIVAVNGEATEMSDANGRFAVSGLCPPSAALRVERDGYAPRTLTVPVSAIGRSSVELRLRPVGGEVIVIQGETPEPIDMRSTAKVSGEALERTRGRARCLE
jgi:hypothetical protein